MKGFAAFLLIAVMFGIAGAIDSADQELYEHKVSYDERN